MAKTPISTPPTKGSTVEIRSDEPGFHGAWYTATFLDTTHQNPSPKTKKFKKTKTTTGYLVKYHTLFKDEGLCEPLTEVVDPSFVRPSPPKNVRRNVSDYVKEVEVGEENVEENGEENGGFEVGDVVDAYHRDGWWIGVVGRVVDDGEMRKFVVGFEDPPETVEFEASKLRFHVDWVDGKWWIQPKKKIILLEEESGDGNGTVDACSGFVTPAKGARITEVGNGTARKRTRSCGKKLKSLAGSKVSTKVIVSVSGPGGSAENHQDSPSVEHEMIIAQTCESVDGLSSQKRKRGRKPKLVVKNPFALLQDGHTAPTDIDEQPLSIWFQGMNPLSVLKRSSCYSPVGHRVNSPTQAIVTCAKTTAATTTTTTTTSDYQKDWPFTKRSPIWATIESLELYLTPPQKPHFSPLKEMREDCREGLAIGQMVTFGNLVQKLPDLKPDDPLDVINNSLETLSELETHGFDVGPIRGRLNELLSLKSKVSQHEDSRKEVEKELQVCNHEKSVVEKEIEELRAKMLEAVAVQKEKEKEAVRLQSNLQLVSNQINDLHLAFEKIAAAPL